MSITAKSSRNGGSEEVRSPIEPLQTDVDAWFRDLDRFSDEPFMEEGRNQPKMPVRKIF